MRQGIIIIQIYHQLDLKKSDALELNLDII